MKKIATVHPSITMRHIAVGDKVSLKMPYMTKPDQVGKIHSVVNWFHGEVRYEVLGEGFITIARADQFEPVNTGLFSS